MTAELQTISDFIRYATSRFNEAKLSFTHGFDSALDEATYLTLQTLHLPHDMPPVYANSMLLESERKLLLARIERRLQREPIAYITGEAWFCGLPFEVNPDVLIPRSPIAELIEQRFQPWLTTEPSRILDLCTGSGCIAIAMARHFPEAEVDGVDISRAALRIAARNADKLGVNDQVEWIESDLFDGVARRRYELIVSNPPYVSESEMRELAGEFAHEPGLGLVSGTDGLNAPLMILHEASDYLTQDGLLVLEVGASEHDLQALFPDLPGTWVEFKRGGSGVLAVSARELASYRPQINRALTERMAES
jgi:ribosomal protein L3 glutamine methyltransferase